MIENFMLFFMGIIVGVILYGGIRQSIEDFEKKYTIIEKKKI